MNKKPTKEEAEQRRAKKEAELREKFQQSRKEFCELTISTENELRKLYENAEDDKRWFYEGFLDEEGYVKKELEKYDDEQTKYPTGKYKDAGLVAAEYQKYFMGYIRELCPEVIEELKEFVSQFKLLINEETEKYLDLLRKLRRDLLLSNFRLHSTYDRYEVFDRDFSYCWGRNKVLLNFISVKLNPSLLDSLDSARKRQIEEVIQNESYSINNATNLIRKAFSEMNAQNDAQDNEGDDNIVSTFCSLQLSLLDWAKKYHIEKDWIINYAYYLLWQFSHQNKSNVDELEFGTYTYRSFKPLPFEFNARGWHIGEETAKDYKRGITEYFKKKFEEYLDDVYRWNDLDSVKKVTRPKEYDRIKWLVQWTVQECTKEQILDELATQNLYYDVSTVDKAFRLFIEYNLPVR
ncbi:MAG: hypothetical protein ACK5NT_05055 [Pyrinomonadaceae bacterium]